MEVGRKKRFDGGIGGEELVCSTVLSTAKDEPITLKAKAENINIRSRKKVGKEGVEGGGKENKLVHSPAA